MKKYIAIIICLVGALFTAAQDLPPATANVQNLPSGSYVIAMDNTLQGTGGVFNLNAYGLVTYLLNNNVRVKWVINSTKAKDGIDFTVTASRVKPSTQASSNRNFIAGPFVIFAADLPANINALIDNFNGFSGTSSAVNVYQTTASVNVDVRYDYFINGVIWKPKAALFDDGGNWDIHRQYFYYAGIEGAGFNENGAHESSNNWRKSNAADVTVNCYTIVTEAHWEENSPNASEIALMNGIKTFVENGGNFLAECAAVRTYENTLKLHSTGGINPTTEKDFKGAASVVVYPNPMLSYSQFHGAVDIDKGGSLTNWSYLGTLSNNEHDHAKAPGTGTGANNTGASVARITGSSPGGLVFYLGQHEYNSTTNMDVVNGVRMYLNAFLTPTNPQSSLKTSVITQCMTNLNDPTVVTCLSASGPSAAYPLTYNLYADIAAPFASANIAGDVFLGTATITAPGQTPTITIPVVGPNSEYRKNTNYVVIISPNSGCLQPIARVPNFCASTLPVAFHSFMAARTTAGAASVQLTWTTLTEINNAGFDIEINKGNNIWQSVGFVSTLASGGNSNAELTYSFTHVNNERSISQYRLKQVDINGKINYSDIRSVRGLDQKGSIIIYPNPSTDGRINVVFDEANTVRDIAVQDMSGRVVKKMNAVTGSNIQIEDLTPGMYTIRVFDRNTGAQSVQKIVVNKR